MRKQNRLILISILFCLVIIISIAIVGKYQREEDLRFVKEMGAGWNLGNSLDVDKRGKQCASPETYEVYWNNPVTSKELIDEVAEAGFRTIRIPVTWYEHMDTDGTIDAKWLDRVNEVVDYAIDNNMYVIINVHHDAWYTPDDANREMAGVMMESIWNQIALRFKDYDQHLLFEGMNEPRLIGTSLEWTDGNHEAREIVNELNEIFVNTVRETGGFNSDRYLLVTTYCASGGEAAVDSLILPDAENLIVSIHEYIPYSFALKEDGTSKWDVENTDDTEEIDEVMKRLRHSFIRQGIPVIITEFGAVDKDNLDERLAWTEYYVQAASQNDIMTIWWDAGGEEDDESRSCQLLDRHKLEWVYPQIVDVLLSR